ncbi:MAG: hypothetical protein JXR37_01330 [Kiritimatiellae bacterium]|nr:hypothetical protein [Kiritimatiellia bacterium]
MMLVEPDLMYASDQYSGETNFAYPPEIHELSVDLQVERVFERTIPISVQMHDPTEQVRVSGHTVTLQQLKGPFSERCGWVKAKTDQNGVANFEVPDLPDTQYRVELDPNTDIARVRSERSEAFDPRALGDSPYLWRLNPCEKTLVVEMQGAPIPEDGVLCLWVDKKPDGWFDGERPTQVDGMPGVEKWVESQDVWSLNREWLDPETKRHHREALSFRRNSRLARIKQSGEGKTFVAVFYDLPPGPYGPEITDTGYPGLVLKDPIPPIVVSASAPKPQMVTLVVEKKKIVLADIRGVVMDDEGNAVAAGHNVHLHGFAVDTNAVTDEHGGYAFSRLQPGDYRLGPSVLGYVDGGTSVLLSGTNITCDLQVHRIINVSGTLRRPGGEPVTNALVVVPGVKLADGRTARGASAETDTRGRYSFKCHRASAVRTFSVGAGRNGPRLALNRAFMQDEQFDIVLPRGLLVEGKAVFTPGTPLRDKPLQAVAFQEKYGWEASGVWAEVGADGAFSWRLVPGVYRVLLLTAEVWDRADKYEMGTLTVEEPAGKRAYTLEVGPDIEKRRVTPEQAERFCLGTLL